MEKNKDEILDEKLRQLGMTLGKVIGIGLLVLAVAAIGFSGFIFFVLEAGFRHRIG